MARAVITFLFCLCFANSIAFAGPCDEYKKNPDIQITKAEWKRIIKPSDTDLWPVGGFVAVVPFNSVAPKMGYVFNGKYYCVFLDSVDVTIGFKDFVITIDKKYEKDSCEYNAVLEHENHHIKDAENALEKIFPDLEDVLHDAVNSVQPIYVEDADSVPYAMEKIQNQIIQNEKLTKLVDEFKEQQEKDAHVLDSEPDKKLEKCTVDKVNAAIEKYFGKKK